MPFTRLFLRDSSKCFLAAGLLLTVNLLHAAVPPDLILMIKAVGWEQTSAAGAFAPEKSRLFVGAEFSINILGSNAVLRGAAETPSLGFDSQTSFSYETERASETELDRAFPDGSYTLAILGTQAATYPFTFRPPAAPAPVRIANFDALQSLTTSGTVVRWDSIPGATDNDLLSLSVEDTVGNEVYSSPGPDEPGGLTGRSQQVTVPGLRVGQRYIGTLFYARLATAGTQPSVVTARGVSTRFAVGYGSTPPDTVRPQLLSCSVPNGARLPGDWVGPMVLTFSEPMRPITDPFRISGLDGNASLSWSADGRALTVTLSVPLRPRQYSFSLDAGPLGFTDLAGNLIFNTSPITSSFVTFTITPLPLAFTRQPIPHTVVAGDTVVLDVLTSGSPATSYLWSKVGVSLAVSTAEQFRLPDVTVAQSGQYRVLVQNDAGTLLSDTVQLTVLPAGSTRSRLINLSTRTNSGPGDQSLFMGVVLGGVTTGSSRPLLLRGAGPALTAFGVAGALADPTLTLFRAGSDLRLDGNDDWGTAAQTATVAAQVGAFAFPPGSQDAALSRTLEAGGYTVQISGKSGASGLALAEIYDASSASGTAAPRLINLSTRAQIGTDSDALIAGFVVGAPTSRTLLVRGIGPALASFGVGGALHDPRLEVRDQAGRLIAVNDNWDNYTSTVMADTFSRVGAFALPLGSKDAALLVTLPPGNYTAVVTGANGSTGVALVEVYEVP